MMAYLHGRFSPPPRLWPLIAREQSLEEALTRNRTVSDIYIVELSSAKHITLGRVSVQLNYLTSHFESYFADSHRAATFWKLACIGDQQKIDDHLSDWESSADTEVLRQIRRTTTTETELRADVRALLHGLPQVLFVSPVNACRPDGRTIPSRAAFAAQVKTAVIAEGGTIFDPTPLMQSLGQNFALSDNDGGLAHYTEPFGLTLGEALADAAFVQLERPVRHLLNKAPDAEGDPLYRVQEARRIGNQVRAVTLLTPLLATCPDAATALAEIVIDHDHTLLDGFDEATLEKAVRASSKRLAPRLEALLPNLTRDRVLRLASLPSQPLLDTIVTLLSKGMLQRTAEILTACSSKTLATQSIRRQVDILLAGLSKEMDNTVRRAILGLARRLAHDNPVARHALRSARKTYIIQARKLGMAGQLAALDDLAVEANMLLGQLPEIALIQARLHFNAGAFDAAIQLGQVAARAWPEKITVWAMLMRAASSLGDRVQSTEFANQIIANRDDASTRLQQEAERTLARYAAS